jgi:hypothetical protein
MIVGKGDKLFAYVFVDPEDPPKAIMLQYHTSEWLHRANWGDDDAIPYGEKDTSQKLLKGPLPKSGEWVRLEVDADALGLKPGAKIDGLAFTQFGGTVSWDHAGIYTALPQEDRSPTSQIAWERLEKLRDPPDAPQDVVEAIKKGRNKRSPEQVARIRNYYVANVYAPTRPKFDPFLKEIADARKRRQEIENSLTATMVSQEMSKPRGAFILKRGEYDKRLDPVQPGVPAMLPPLPAGQPVNRLAFARWLVSPDHPLTARVIVNRFWQQLFGIGLVKSAADFGNQGEWPSDPALLDWLATEFLSSGWDVKHMLRLMVTSAAYRQASNVNPLELRIDPSNRLLERGPRFRLDAEEIRDNALFVSGLLIQKMGGHSVKPYQPAGIWEAVGYTTSNTAKFSQDHGDALYRRSLYTFWKRTAAPPYLTTFDAPSREKYCVRRERTDTPLQALITLNDPCYVEAARHLAARMMHEDSNLDRRLDFGFRLVTARHPSTSELAVLENALNNYSSKYVKDEEAARKLIATGESPVDDKLNPSELAAYTMVASILLNMDEVLNKN